MELASSTPPAHVPIAPSSRSLALSTQSGDIVLRYVDGQEFPVHSIIISLASPVFADMFEVGSRGSGETIELAETGEMIDIMLKFIYPKQSPLISSFDLLEKALHVADKYQLDDMHQQLRQQLSSRGSAISMHSHPLKALGIASAHSLKEEVQIAASLAHKQYDFTTVDDLLSLPESAPAATTWIVVIGIPGVKCTVIAEVLFNYNEYPMRPPEELRNLCHRSRAGSRNCYSPPYGHRAGPSTRYSPPEWLARWSYAAFQELTRRPLSNWAPCFDLPFLYEAIGRHGGVPICSGEEVCTCLENLSLAPRAQSPGQTQATSTPSVRYPDRFSEWSYRVYHHLKMRLNGLEELESLIKVECNEE